MEYASLYVITYYLLTAAWWAWDSQCHNLENDQNGHDPPRWMQTNFEGYEKQGNETYESQKQNYPPRPSITFAEWAFDQQDQCDTYWQKISANNPHQSVNK